MTRTRPFTLIAAVLFALAALLHLYRLFTHFQIVGGSHEIPQWASYVGIGDELLVDHAMDCARRDLIEVAHQAHVIAVIEAEVLETVREFLPAGEMLLEVGEAARERVPARVDDLGVREDQLDQAGVDP